MPTYNWRPVAEAAWFVAVAVLTIVLQALMEFDPEKIGDLKVWAVGIGSASIRAGAGALLAYFVNPVRPSTQEAKDAKIVTLAEKIAETAETPAKPPA